MQLLAKGFSEDCQQVSVIALQQEGEAPFSRDGDVLIWRFKPSHLHWYVSKIPWLGKNLSPVVRELERSWGAWRLLQKINQQKEVHAVELIETGGLFISLLERAKLIAVRLHGEQYTFQKYTPFLQLNWGLKLTRFIQRVAIRNANLRISPSHWHAQEIAEETGLNKQSILVLSNAIAIPTKFQFSNNHANPLILFAGRLEQLKGVPLLLEAFALLRKEMPHVRLALAGTSHPSLPESQLKELIHQYHLEKSVQLLGYIPNQQLKDWFKKSSALVLPSYYESFGLAALEAMAHGLPVVASTAGALPELIKENETGLLFKSGDAQALAGQLKKILSSPKLQKHLAKNAHRFSLQHFNAKESILQNLTLYKNNLKIPPSPKHVFFSPHLDDVILSCGGTVKELNKNAPVEVVTVFSGQPKTAAIGTFAEHIHAKWNLPPQTAILSRRDEDLLAFSILSPTIQVTHWGYLEALYRQEKNHQPLHSAYQSLRGPLHQQEEALIPTLVSQIENHYSKENQLYFPMGLGTHVDHRILFKTGYQLNQRGWPVFFYEDWPYAENYEPISKKNWQVLDQPISLTEKIKAAEAYGSQQKGLGYSLADRLTNYAHQNKNPLKTSERIWQAQPNDEEVPFKLKKKQWQLADFLIFYKSLNWRDLSERLPLGSGYCLDIGSGSGRNQVAIETKGYTWLGLDLNRQRRQHLQASASRLPVASQSVEAAILWQVLEYLENPQQALAEAIRTLKPGGVLCGSVSFLEPVHGQTYYGISHHAIQKLLIDQPLLDIQIQPGISGFTLLIWTWLNRLGLSRLSGLCLPLSRFFLVPPAALLFLVSWLQWRLGWGSGHFMAWLTERAPLEFAGHIHFIARKAS